MPETIVIVGAGRLGRGLASLFSRAGRSVALASRDPGRVAGPVPTAIRWVPLDGAAQEGEIVVLATRWEHTREALERAGPFDGRIVIDATNPEAADGRSLAVGHTTSGAEMIAEMIAGRTSRMNEERAPTARIVKAFNHTYAELLEEGPAFPGGVRPAVLVCGDDPAAKRTVAGLIEESGFDPVDAGPLSSARYLEPVAALFVELVRGRGRAPADVALSLLTRETGKEKEPTHAERVHVHSAAGRAPA
jgi:predicted dinucleotide-binding enzyme